MSGNPILSVSQLNRYVKSVLEGDFRLKDLYLKGELSNFTHHGQSGHFYFTLKEGGSSVKAIMFASYAEQLRFEPENGMSVILRCSVSLYERDGAYQIYATEMQPEGKGDLQVAFEQLYQKLSAQGYFSQERKRSLPRFPERIGVISSENGAALHDIVSIIHRRFPPARIILCPALVQGSSAVASLIAGLREMNAQDVCDLIILGRGGGSMEDLWAFNSEDLVKEIAASRLPVVSAVGHETDMTLCDFVADLRAPTPSAAAELVVPNIDDVRYTLLSLESKIERIRSSRISEAREHLNQILARQCFKNTSSFLYNNTKKTEQLAKTIRLAVSNAILYKSEQLKTRAAALEGMNPMGRLRAGYSISTDLEGRLIHSVHAVVPGSKLITFLQDGYIESLVEQVIEGEE